MFTFGMFTTHIPYVALVAFYAYFLLFGMEKASNGEILAESKNPFIYELQVSDHFEANSSVCFYYQAADLFAEYSKFEDHIFKRESGRTTFIKAIHYRFHYSPLTSNRPPPFLG